MKLSNIYNFNDGGGYLIMLFKKFKLIVCFSLVIIFLSMITTNIIAANGQSAINNLGQYYVDNGILYFKGTMNGITHDTFVPISGAENQSGVALNKIVTAIYAFNDSHVVISDRGSAHSYGVGAETIVGGSTASNTNYRWLGGTYHDRIESLTVTNQGAVIKYANGNTKARGPHISSSAEQYDGNLNGSANEEMFVLSSTNLARTNDGKLWIGNSKYTMTNITAFNGENVIDIAGSTADSGTDQMWALTDANRLLYSNDGTTWTVSATDVTQLFHDLLGNTVIIKTDGSYYTSSSGDPSNFIVKPIGTVYSDTTNVFFDGTDMVIHNGNDFYTTDDSNTFSHSVMMSPTYDSNGFDNQGLHQDTGTEFDANALTKDGDEYDLAGYDINGNDVNGFNADGIDSRGFNSSGDNTITGTRFDVDHLAYDGTAYDNGYDWEGFDADGYNINSFDRSGLFKDCIVGTTTDNYECRFNTDAASPLFQQTVDGENYYEGRDYLGMTAGGLDQNGFRTVAPNIGFNEFTNSWFGTDNLTHDGQQYYNGYDWQGLDASGYDSSGYDISGLDANLFNVDGLWNGTTFYFDQTQCSSGVSITQDGTGYYNGYDCLGYNADGYDENGFDINGLDDRGFYNTGLHSVSATYFNPTDNLTIESLEFDPLTHLTFSGSEFGSDTLTWNDGIYGTNGRDYLGYDENGFLEDGTHRNGTLYDDNGFNINGWTENGVFRDGGTVRNGFLTKQFTMAHSVERDSFFKTLVKRAKVDKAGITTLGDIFIRNNTRDGFEVSIDSTEGGVLHPTGISEDTLDGELDIPYSIILEREGDVGVGIDESLEFSSSQLASAAGNRQYFDDNNQIRGLKILQIAGGGSNASSATNLKYSLNINIVDDSNIMEMADQTTDTLTLTYRDI
jgi:hypothetical protein